MHILGLGIEGGACKGAELPPNEIGNIDIILPEMGATASAKALDLEAPAITKLKCATEMCGDQDAEMHDSDAQETQSGKPKVIVTKHGSSRELGGSVRVMGPNGNPLELDPDSGEICFPENENQFQCEAAKGGDSKAVAGGADECPPTTLKCLQSGHRDDWIDSMGNEVGGLIDMEVIDMGESGDGYTLAEIRNQGVDKPPVPIGLYHEHKHGSTGEVAKRKTRAAVQGHSGNMYKGVHFWATFAATPREDTCRIMQAIMVRDNLFQKSGDIAKAYCWAPLPKDQWLVARMPKPYRTFNEQGEELYALVKKNLCGAPPAGRNWSKCRDYNLLFVFNHGADQRLKKRIEQDQVEISERAMSVFNSGACKGWSCWQTEMDPCLFAPLSPSKARSLVMIHTDDLDAIGEQQEDLGFIFEQIDKIWEVKEVPSDFILGANRLVVRGSKQKILSSEMTMQAYCEGAAKAFESEMPSGNVNEFFPEKLLLLKGDACEAEIKRDIDKGYMRGAGIALWAARHVFPEGKFGVSQFTLVMSCPSDKAFRALMLAIAYMGQRSKRGIKFSHGGNSIPFGMFDASNKPNPDNGLAQGGHVITMMNGPISTLSKRLHHVGLSSEHNECMALAACIKVVIWLRQLLEDTGDGEYVKDPTKLFGDNIQANNLSQEHFTSTGNQYIFIPYHFNREAHDLGLIEVIWTKSGNNLADIMTKALPGQKTKGLSPHLLGCKPSKGLQDLLMTTLDEAANKVFKKRD